MTERDKIKKPIKQITTKYVFCKQRYTEYFAVWIVRVVIKSFLIYLWWQSICVSFYTSCQPSG